MAQVIPELLYRQVLQTGFTWLRDNPQRLAEMMVGLISDDDAQTVQDVRTYFGSSTNRVEVVQGWPGKSTRFPCVCLILENDNDEVEFIGRVAEIGLTSDLTDGMKFGRMWNSKIMFLCCTHNSDLTVFLYYIVKLILEKYQKTMAAAGLHNLKADGADLQPKFDFLPDTITLRGLNVAASYFLTVQEDHTGPVSVGITADPR